MDKLLTTNEVAQMTRLAERHCVIGDGKESVQRVSASVLAWCTARPTCSRGSKNKPVCEDGTPAPVRCRLPR